MGGMTIHAFSKQEQNGSAQQKTDQVFLSFCGRQTRPEEEEEGSPGWRTEKARQEITFRLDLEEG